MHRVTTIRSAVIAATAAVAIPALGTSAHAQIDDSIRGAPSEANHFFQTPQGWQHPMTEWGEPDITATLDMMQAGRVPFERCADSYRPGAPPCDPDRAWHPEEEHAARMEEYYEEIRRIQEEIDLLPEGELMSAFRAGAAGPSRIPQRQTNLLVDPPNGLLPELTPEGKLRAYEMASDWPLPGEDMTFDGLRDFDSWDRCVTRGMPSMMMPYRYNGGFRIWQTPGYVIFETEMIHDARIIPTDGRPALDGNVRQWLGDSRGRWEGTTLVVETTNFPDGMRINNPMMNLGVQGSPPGNRFPHSDQMRITERLVRLNDDVWLYEITTEDPVILTEPFTVRYPMRHDPLYWWPEYACHEGNTAIPYFIETDRYRRDTYTQAPPLPPVEAQAEVAEALDGRWVGSPRIATIDYDIELRFIRHENGSVSGRLIGTTLGEIDRPLEGLRINGRQLEFTLPNVDPWDAAMTLTEEGTLEGSVFSIQGPLPVTFRRIDAPTAQVSGL